jgi:hypothetical protein
LRGWLVPGLTACLACSDGRVHSGSLPEAADFLPMAGDSGEDTLTGQQPRLILRCENGRLGAYIVLGPPGEAEPDPIDAHAVAVDLDSAPAC